MRRDDRPPVSEGGVRRALGVLALALVPLIGLIAMPILVRADVTDLTPGRWSAGAGVGFWANTPDGVEFGLEGHAEYFWTRTFSVGPLAQYAGAGNDQLVGVSVQAKRWWVIPGTRRPVRLAVQGGLGLPDRDYYTRTDAESIALRDKYVAHVAGMLQLLGDEPAAFLVPRGAAGVTIGEREKNMGLKALATYEMPVVPPQPPAPGSPPPVPQPGTFQSEQEKLDACLRNDPKVIAISTTLILNPLDIADLVRHCRSRCPSRAGSSRRTCRPDRRRCECGEATTGASSRSKPALAATAMRSSATSTRTSSTRSGLPRPSCGSRNVAIASTSATG